MPNEIERLFEFNNIMENPHSVYILIKDKKAVYVGCSKDVRTRVRAHRKSKDFDSHTILKRYKTKKEALTAENAIIRFLTLFGDCEWYNAEYILLSYERDIKIRN